jgi:hypothetical protein
MSRTIIDVIEPRPSRIDVVRDSAYVSNAWSNDIFDHSPFHRGACGFKMHQEMEHTKIDSNRLTPI